MRQRIPIRAKLALALLIPVLAIFAVSIYEVGQANSDVDRVRQDTDLATSALGPEGLIRALQDERNDSAVSAVGLRGSAGLPTEDLTGTREVVDAASREFRAALAQSGPQAEGVYTEALDEFDTSVAALRKAYDADTRKASFVKLGLSNEMWSGYSETINQIINANTRLTLLIDDPELRSAAEMLDAISRQVDSLGTMVRTGIISSLGGEDTEGTRISDVIASINRFEVNAARIDVLATGDYGTAAAKLDQNTSYRAAVDQLDEYIADGTLDVTAIINAVSKRPTPNLDTVATETASSLRARATELRADAEGRQRTFIGLSLLVFVAGGAFLFLAARSITRPLLSLTRQADEMAAQTLPSAVKDILDTPLGEDVVIPEVAPVAVKTRDEVQDVATALNSVQRSALDLAVEQAVLRRNISDSFVNLGRRTQNLIGRQLDFISELERNETDPAVLDNLFKLDHLATRARRNAESLVVLAGLVTPRTWTAPIAIADVIRAALGEVEDYQRVEARIVTDATVPGQVAADLVHLMAELLENGLSFSPPGRPVEVFGRMTRNGYVLAVVDQGIGMSETEMDVANERLAGREAYTVAPSKYLGHYVAGSLAQRIGVVVRLSDSPTGGVAAKIVIPEHVLDQAPALAAPAPKPAQDPTPEATSAPESSHRDEARSEEPPEAVDVPPADEPSTNDFVEATARLTPEVRTENGLRKRVRSGPNGSDQPSRSEADDDPAPPATTEPMTAPVAAADPVAAPQPVADSDPPATPEPMPVAGATPPAATTANGLQKRVRGAGIAETGIGRQINRGSAATDKPAQDASPTMAADDMFSLLSNFESGAARGREHYSHMLTDLDEDGNQPSTAPEDQP